MYSHYIFIFYPKMNIIRYSIDKVTHKIDQTSIINKKIQKMIDFAILPPYKNPLNNKEVYMYIRNDNKIVATGDWTSDSVSLITIDGEVSKYDKFQYSGFSNFLVRSSSPEIEYHYISTSPSEESKVSFVKIPPPLKQPLKTSDKILFVENRDMIYFIYQEQSSNQLAMDSYVKGSQLGRNFIDYTTQGVVLGVSMPYKRHISKHRILMLNN